MALIIGLTGGIASGKSTISSMLKKLNIPVVDADLIARKVVEPGEEAYKRIIQSFGNEMLQDDGSINRKKLGEVVFSNEEKRKQLNSIVHPAIRKKMLDERNHYVDKGATCVVLDIPLLFESQLTHFVDKTIVVYVDYETQLKRLMKRDQFTKEEAIQRIRSQMLLKDKASLADAVINNNGTIEESREQLIVLLKEWDVIKS